MNLSHIRPIIRLATPLVLSASTIVVQQLIDAIVLGYHSENAIAAMGPSSMAVVLVQGLLFGTSGYSSMFVARAHGANDPPGERHAAWMGLRVSFWAGIAMLLLAWPIGAFFFHIGHGAELASGEALYFRILAAGSFLPTASACLSGWLSARKRTLDASLISILSLVVNAILAPPLVLGLFGLPRLGLAGAAFATLAGQAASTATLFLLFQREDGFRHASDRTIPRSEMRDFLYLAIPQGLRISVELLAWSAFLVFIGRIGVEPLAASSIAFRINGMAFFPAMGVGQAAGILVAHAIGANRERDIAPIARQALLICEAWMILFAIVFLLLPIPLLRLFHVSNPTTIAHGVVILRFVAVYCIFDAANAVLGFVLASLGDTRWTLGIFLVATTTFLLALTTCDRFAPTVSIEWGLATLFVMATALAWILRLRSKREFRVGES